MEGKTQKKVSRATKKEKITTYILKFTKKGPFNIHLKDKRHDTPLMEGGKKGKKWGQFDTCNVMAKSKISFQFIKQYGQFIWEVTFSDKMETNEV
jgi:hypothetical protein